MISLDVTIYYTKHTREYFRNCDLDVWEKLVRKEFDSRLEAMREQSVDAVSHANWVVDEIRRLNISDSTIKPDVNLVSWAGLMVSVRLRKDKSFLDLTEIIKETCEHFKLLVIAEPDAHLPSDGDWTHDVLAKTTEPELHDYPEISRRSWTWRTRKTRFTICAFFPPDSEYCRKVAVGEPYVKQEERIVCDDGVAVTRPKEDAA